MAAAAMPCKRMIPNVPKPISNGTPEGGPNGRPCTRNATPPSPSGATPPATWSAGSSHGYEFQVTLQVNAAGQGLSGTETLTFEADNT